MLKDSQKYSIEGRSFHVIRTSLELSNKALMLSTSSAITISSISSYKKIRNLLGGGSVMNKLFNLGDMKDWVDTSRNRKFKTISYFSHLLFHIIGTIVAELSFSLHRCAKERNL